MAFGGVGLRIKGWGREKGIQKRSFLVKILGFCEDLVFCLC